MARIRTIKPEFWQDEKLAPLDALTRLVFLGLISQADDAGRLIDNVKLIDGLLFPETDESSRDALDTLARLGRIIRYTSESGQRLIQIAKWSEHQRVDKPSKHTLPPPPSEVMVSQGDTEPSRDTRETLRRHSGDPRAPTMDHGPRKKDLKPTEDKSSEAAPRNHEPLPPVEPGEPDDPDPDHREFNARIAPLIREHLWLGKYPPRLITRQDPGWNMGRELNVARRLVKRSGVTVEALEGAIRHARAALGFDDTVPLTMKIFHARGRHDRFELAVAAWRRSQIRTTSGPEKAGDILAPLVAAAGGARG